MAKVGTSEFVPGTGSYVNFYSKVKSLSDGGFIIVYNRDVSSN